MAFSQLTRIRLTAWMCLAAMIFSVTHTLLAPVANAEVNKIFIQEAQNPDETRQADLSGNRLVLPLKTLGDPDGYTLKTVKTERMYYFTRPQGWGIAPSSNITVTFQHSPSLLPERSSLNVKLNNRVLKTIRLSDANVETTTVSIPVPPDLLKDNNTVSFQVDQHYTYQCEDPFSEELWTTLLPETRIQLNYSPLPVKPDLAQFPYPMFDPLGYGKTTVNYGVSPEKMSSQSLTALAVASAGIANAAGWRPFEANLVSPSQARSASGNTVLIGTPEENSAIASLGSSLPISPSSLGEGEGAIMMIPNPGKPTQALLIITGSNPDGVRKAANVLFQKPASKLLVGEAAVVKEWHAGLEHPYRAWQGFAQHSGATFAQMGFDTESTRGITATALFYNLKIMPDLFLPGKTQAKLKTVYSYSSQLDPKMSKLEIRINGKAIKSIPLDNEAGEAQKTVEIEIPAEEFYTYNDLEYQFFLYPDKFDICNFTTDAHIWGTIHNTSSVELPGDVRTPIPDVGLINDGAFPFTAYPDLSNTTVVLPESPSTEHIQTMMAVMSRIGRLSTTRTGFQVTAYKANELPGDAKSNNHLIVIGNAKDNAVANEVPAKVKKLVAEEGSVTLNGNEEQLAKLKHNPSQGVVEEVLSPWHGERVVLLLYGENQEAYNRIQTLFNDEDAFASIKAGSLLVVNPKGQPSSVTAINKGEARFVYEDDLTKGWKFPIWGWIILVFFALLGVIGFLRFLFGR